MKNVQNGQNALGRLFAGKSGNEHTLNIAASLGFAFSGAVILGVNGALGKFFFLLPALFLAAFTALFLVCLFGRRKLRLRTKRLLRFLTLLSALIVLGSAVGKIAEKEKRVPAERLLAYAGEEEHVCDFLVEKRLSHSGVYDAYSGKLLFADGKMPAESGGIDAYLCDFGLDTLEVGSVVETVCTLRAPKKSEDSFDEEGYLAGRGIFLVLEPKENYTEKAYRAPSFFSRLRSGIRETMTRYIGNADAAAVSVCCLCGDKSLLGKEIKENYRNAGVSHVLAVSGLHLSVLMSFLLLLPGMSVSSSRKKRKTAGGAAGGRKSENVRMPTLPGCILLPFLALFYMALADLSPSVTRAGLMVIIHCLYLLYRRFCENGQPWLERYAEKAALFFPTASFDGVSSLALALMAVSLFAPYSLLDVGMRLSVLSTLGILLLVKGLEGLFNRISSKLLRGIVTVAAVSLAAVSFSFVTSLAFFGTLSLFSLLTNLEITLFVTVLLIAGALLATVGAIPGIGNGALSFLPSFLGKVCGLCAGVCNTVVKSNASRRFSVVHSIPSLPEILIPIAAVIILLALLARILGKKRLSGLFASAMVLLYVFTLGLLLFADVSAYNGVKYSFYTLKSIPYASVSKGGEVLFIDSGEGLFSHEKLTEVSYNPFSRDRNIYLALKSPSGSWDVILDNLTLYEKDRGVMGICLPDAETAKRMGDIEGYTGLLQYVSEKDIPMQFFGQSIRADGFTLEILPEDGFTAVCGKDFAFLYTEKLTSEIYSRLSGIMEKGGSAIVFTGKTDRFDHDSESFDLYLSTSVGKKILGSLHLPTQKPLTLVQGDAEGAKTAEAEQK